MKQKPGRGGLPSCPHPSPPLPLTLFNLLLLCAETTEPAPSPREPSLAAMPLPCAPLGPQRPFHHASAPSLFFSYFFSPSHSLSLFLSFSTRNVIIQHRANGEQTAKNHASDNYFLDVPYDTRCCDRCRYNCGLDIDLTVVIHRFLWIQTRRKDIAIQHEEI